MRNFFILVFLIGILASGCESTPNSNDTSKKGDIEISDGISYTGTLSDGQKPQDGDKVDFHVIMRTADSTIFNSYQRGPQNVIIRNYPEGSKKSPVIEGLRIMSLGDSIDVTYVLDSNDRKRPGFQNIDKLYYSLKLLNIKTKADIDAEKAKYQKQENEIADLVTKTADDYRAGRLKGIKTTASGLKYIIHSKGNGTPPTAGDLVFVNYYGALTDGKAFDNSFKRGRPFDFTLGQGQVIPGWDEGIALLKPGATAIFFIPPGLAYGERGAGKMIPPNSELVFYVELVKVAKK